MNKPYISFLIYTSILAGVLLTACEEIDDGSFTPQVIAEPEIPTDPTYTVEDPCLTASCGLQSMTLDAGSATLTQEFYANYEVFRDTAIWGTMTSAIIVVHGNNRNANEYFNWMTNAVLSLNKQDETVIIAPQFKIDDDLGGNTELIYWSNNGWKRGFSSVNITSVKYSSYDVVDTLMQRLADKSTFPNLKKIILTGHSAGAQFTNLYAAASPMPDQLGDMEVEYLVANSQYFFYPGPERWDPNSNQFVTPSGCSNYQNWPYGTASSTTYLSRFEASDIRSRYASRKLTYLLGTLDIFTSGTLNTTDCAATLLGENRFRRGENMFSYMETFFSSNNPHTKVTVPNVGHSAPEMYNSAEGLMTLGEMLP